MRVSPIHWKVGMGQSTALTVKRITVTVFTIFKPKGQDKRFNTLDYQSGTIKEFLAKVFLYPHTYVLEIKNYNKEKMYS